MYPLDRGWWGPTVRIGHLRDELANLVALDVVDGYRGSRRLQLARYAASGRMRRLDGIYVESSTFLPAEADLALLGLAQALRIPVVTYIRDAYQLFGDDYPAETLRRRIGNALFRPMTRALRAVSDRLAFPTIGLARAVAPDLADPLILPPGAPTPVDVSREPGADQLLFVGDARLPAQGGARLLRAVERARDHGARVEVTSVSRPGQEPPAPHPDWLHVRRAEAAAIHQLLPRVLASVIPRPRTAYNDLALPIKLFDALAYGRPLLVTDCVEQARVVADADAGIVTPDDPGAMADAIERLVAAPPDTLDAWSRHAHDAAQEAAWSHRARAVVDALLGR